MNMAIERISKDHYVTGNVHIRRVGAWQWRIEGGNLNDKPLTIEDSLDRAIEFVVAARQMFDLNPDGTERVELH